MLHYGDHRLRRRDRSKKIRLKHVATSGHIHPGHRIDESVAGVVDPQVDPPEVMQRRVDHPVNFLAMANVAGEGKRAFGSAYSSAGRFGTRGVAESSTPQVP